MAVSSINSSSYNFGSLASIRQQAEAVAKRVEAESAARIAEQERTGLIQNPDTGEMVELSSISEETRERWEYREQLKSVSPQEALLAALATAPHADEIEENKALAAKLAKIQEKLLAGKKLTGAEKKFAREHDPAMAAMADRMEQEAAQLEKSLRGCKSKEEAQQAYMDAKMRIMSGASKEDGSILFYFAALDATYSEYLKQGASSEKKLDIWA